MRKQMQKVFSLLLVLVMVMGMLPMNAFATETKEPTAVVEETTTPTEESAATTESVETTAEASEGISEESNEETPEESTEENTEETTEESTVEATPAPVCTCMGKTRCYEGTMNECEVCQNDLTLCLGDEPEPELTAPPIQGQDYPNEKKLVLSVPKDYDSYTWELLDGEIWKSVTAEGLSDGQPTLEARLDSYGAMPFRCAVTKDGISTITEPYVHGAPVLPVDVGASAQNDYMWCIQTSAAGLFNVKGVNGSSYIETTYSNAGYYNAFRVNGTTYTNPNASAVSGLTLSVEPMLAGSYVYVLYKVTNNSTESVTFDFGTYADIEVDDDDKTNISPYSGGKGMTMTSNTGKVFNVVVPNANTMWCGNYSNRQSNVFNDSTSLTTDNIDSGIAWSFHGTVAPGTTWTDYAMIGVGTAGEAPPTPTIAVDTDWVFYSGIEKAIAGTASNSSVVYISVDGMTYSTRVNADGSFSVPITIPAAHESEENVPIMYWSANESNVNSIFGNATGKIIHTHSYSTMKSDENNHWSECSCGAKSGETAHCGGTATCTAKANCEVCGIAYGELLDHSYTVPQKDKTHHWNKCSGCDGTDTKVEHSGTDDGDCTTALVCSCGYVITEAKSHSFTNDCDTSCNNSGCNHTREITHSPNEDDGDCTTAITCSVCGEVTTAAKAEHSFDNACDTGCNNSGCTYIRTITHAPTEDDGDCTTAITCSVCGEVTTAAKEHSFDNDCDTSCNNSGCSQTREITHSYQQKYDGQKHWMECSVCHSIKDETAHTYSSWTTVESTDTHSKSCACGHTVTEDCADADSDHSCDTCGKTLSECTGGTVTCMSKAKCSVCDEEYGDLGEHNMDTNWSADDEKHWHKCLTDGCTVIKDDYAHSGGTATCTAEAACEICGTEYGEALDHDYANKLTAGTDTHYYACSRCDSKKDEAAHSYKWVTDKAATSTTSGLKHEECVCGAVRNVNTVIPKTDTPQTGDDELPVLWISLFVLSAFGANVAIVAKPKKGKYQH